MAERLRIDDVDDLYGRRPNREDVVAGPVFQPVATEPEADEEGLW